ncbi:MAG: CNNM domain-containing protein, partial [Planctomycetota bacterium]
MPVPDDLHTADGSGLLGWEAVDLPILLLLPLLLVLSGFFSGSETALFGLTETDRMQLRRDGSLSGRAVEALLGNERMLLITLLLGNMTINVLYFVISSVLLMRAQAGVIGLLALAAGSLLLLILLGEVLPKLLANSRRMAFAALVATPLVAIHQVIAPVRIVLDRAVVAPLSRLTAPGEAPPRLDREELAALVEVSGREGVIDDHEQRILQDVISLSQRKARDVMTPRVRMAALPVDASYEQVKALVAETRLTKFPVYREDLDRIVGVLHVKSYLLASDDGDRQHHSLEGLATPVPFV